MIMRNIDCEFFTKEEEAKLVRRWYRTRDRTIRNRIVMGVYPLLIRKLSYAETHYRPLDDMVNTAVVALIECLENGMYDPDRGRLSTYMRMPVNNALRAISGVIRTPANGTWYKSEKLREKIKTARMIQTNADDDCFYKETLPDLDVEREEELASWRQQLEGMVAQLSDRDRAILLDTDTYIKIGAKHGLSRQRIEQIKSQAIERFRLQAQIKEREDE